MSLEQALAGNAAALAANTAALQALTAAIAANPMQAPSAQPAPIPAPYIAAAVQVPIAPVEQTVTSPSPTTAFAQPVPTPPQPVVPAAPPTTPPAASGNAERDSKGMPWDGRIHSSTKAKVADGSWRYKRGTGETYIAQIEAELRGALAAPAVAGNVSVNAPVVGGVGSPYPFPDSPQQIAPAAVQPAPAVVPVAPPPVVAPPAAAAVAIPNQMSAGIADYASLMAVLPAKIASGELTATQLQQACEAAGVPSIAALATRNDLVALVAATLRL